MNKQLVKLILLSVVFSSIVANAEAQRTGRNRNQPPANPQGQTNPPANQPSGQVNNNQPSGFNPYGNIPIEMAPQVGGFGDSIKRSQRQDGAYEKLLSDRTPLPYDDLRSDDALFTERVWREIDIREKINQVFSYKAEDNTGNSQQFIHILVRAIRDKKVVAFSADDDRFTTPLDSAQFERVLSGGNQCDTLPVYKVSDPTQIEKWVIDCKTMNPDDIVKFRIKEDWVFDRESSRMVARIIGIAPLKIIYGLDQKTERGATPLFWIHYPELRPTLIKYEVYNPKNMGNGRMTWEELFESRMFSSYIIKSTLDNPQNRYIRSYIKDPILALLEGDNIREKIFNYEQDLWSY